MYDAFDWEVIGGCTEHAIDLLQFIASAREIRGEDRVGQLADNRKEHDVCNLSEAFQVLKSSYDLNASELESK